MEYTVVLYSAVLLGFIAFSLYLTHRQNMARIAAGLPPVEPPRRSETWRLRGGILAGVLLLAIGGVTLGAMSTGLAATVVEPPARFILGLLGSYLLAGGAVLLVLFAFWGMRASRRPGGSPQEPADDCR